MLDTSEIHYDIWPRHDDGSPSKPNPKQALLFLELMPEEMRAEIAHFHDLDIVLQSGTSGSGKCFAKGTKVVMYDGTMKVVEDVVVGDLLMGPDSKPRTVVDLARGREQMYEIVPNKYGQSFTCNESHILSVKCASNRTKVTNISVADYLKAGSTFRKEALLYRSDAVEFAEHSGSLPIDPYFLGLWLGDGTARTTAITNPDPEILEYIEQYASLYKGLHVHYSRNSSDCPTARITSGLNSNQKPNKLLNKMRDLNLIQNKHIPHRYLTAWKSARLRLLAGIIDSDGHMHEAGYFEVIQKSKQLAEDIAFLARSLGFAVSLRPSQKYCMYKGEKRGGTSWRLSINGHTDTIPTNLPRKQARPRKSIIRHSVTGFQVIPKGKGEYFGFTLEGPDRLFLLEDFTVVHNSIATAARALYIAKTYPGTTIIICSTTYKHLEDSLIKDFQSILSTEKGAWKHPWVRSKPNQLNKTLTIANWKMEGKKRLELDDSFIIFKDVGTDPKKVLSMKADLVVFEEAQRLLDGNALDILITRMRSRVVPFKQIILNINPDEEDYEWLYDWFKLYQLDPKYNGRIEPIAKHLCGCHICEICELREGIPTPYVDGVCPRCGFKKRNKCPGNQDNIRVIKSSFIDNLENLPPTYARDIKKNLSEKNVAAYGEGVFRKRARSIFYENYGDWNVLKGEEQEEIDPDEDIIWHFDFNRRPQCSGITQRRVIDHMSHYFTIDEIVKWRYDVEDVAHEFVARYRDLDFKGTILLYGDPNGMRDHLKRDDGDSKKHNDIPSYFKVRKILKKAGFKCRVKTWDTVFNVGLRADSTNDMIAKIDEETGVKLVRWHVNERARYFRWSAEGTLWDSAGKKEDERFDKNARERGREGEKHCLTHPMASIGYLFVQEHPTIPHKARRGTQFLHANLSTGMMIDLDDEGNVRERPIGVPDMDGDDYEERRQERMRREEAEYKAQQEQEPTSFAGMFRAMGMWSAVPPTD